LFFEPPPLIEIWPHVYDSCPPRPLCGVRFGELADELRMVLLTPHGCPFFLVFEFGCLPFPLPLLVPAWVFLFLPPPLSRWPPPPVRSVLSLSLARSLTIICPPPPMHCLSLFFNPLFPTRFKCHQSRCRPLPRRCVGCVALVSSVPPWLNLVVASELVVLCLVLSFTPSGFALAPFFARMFCAPLFYSPHPALLGVSPLPRGRSLSNLRQR